MKPNAVLLGALTGVLLVLSLPKPDLYPLAWIAFVPLFVVISSTAHVGQTVLASYVAGAVYFGGTCYWITETMYIYGGLPASLALGVGGLFALAHALYFVLFGLGLRLAVAKFGGTGILFAPPLWVTMELLRSILFSGFPWMLTGYALAPYSGILQLVTWTGVYGLSFLATAVNGFLVLGIVQRRIQWFALAAVLVATAWLLPVFGEGPGSDALAVRLVQTNISLDQPWTRAEADRLLDELVELSTRASGKPRLVVWPETPAPFYLSEDAGFRQRMQRIVQELDAYLVVGYIDSTGEGPTNSAGLLNPAGQQISRYNKIHLVPFGEYVPLKPLLFFAESLTRQVGDFMPGRDYTVTQIDGHRLSVIICYESVFPNLVRQFVKGGAEMLVLITNDGWFGNSSAPYQHLRMGVVRAVENRRYMVRTANSGISAIIDPYGKIETETSIGVRTILDGTAYFRSDRTFYTQYGDVFACANAVAVIMLLVWRSNARRTHRTV